MLRVVVAVGLGVIGYWLLVVVDLAFLAFWLLVVVWLFGYWLLFGFLVIGCCC